MVVRWGVRVQCQPVPNFHAFSFREVRILSACPFGPRSHFDFAHVDFDAVAPTLGVFFGVPASGLVILRGVLAIVAFGEDMDDAGCFH